MALQNIPVWSFEPDWSQSVLETYEWLTKILVSRKGAEQRRSLRYRPRRYLEYTTLLEGTNRSLFDNMISGVGLGDYYLPQWHEAFPAALSGGSVVDLPGSIHSLKPGGAVWLQGSAAGALGEVATVSGERITLAAPHGLSGNDLVLHPAAIGRLIDLPSVTRRRDTLAVSRAKMMLIGTEATIDETVDSSGLDQLSTYYGQPLLLLPPHESEELAYGYERLTDKIDNMTSIPIFKDVSSIPFTSQKYVWRIAGQQGYKDFKRMLYALRGRAIAFWAPTFFADFQPTRTIAASSKSLYVKNTGYTAFVSTLRNRQDVCIEYANGSQFCARILSSAVVSATEEVLNFSVDLPPGDPILISYLAEVRLDQDNIELSHATDTAGVTDASTLIRGTPTIRRALPAA